jgi:hypothetical protein
MAKASGIPGFRSEAPGNPVDFAFWRAMLNAKDPGTFIAVRELDRSIRESRKPLVLWIGAGASKWLGYPLWGEFASQLRREFFRYVAGFDNAAALKLIASGNFPGFFQMCRDCDRERYYQVLSSSFLPLPETPLYRRFADALGAITPLRILTTNIDEALEQRFPVAGVFQRSDITGCLAQLQAGSSFIAKLHGSRSAIEGAVFTHDDYEKLKAEHGFTSTLGQVFNLATVVFFGYSVSDQYVVDLLSDNAKDKSLFGAGPHFVVSAGFNPTSSLRRISYSLRRFADHRSALTVLDVIKQAMVRKVKDSKATGAEFTAQPPTAGNPASDAKTAYFISDFMPAGTWTTSQVAQLVAPDGRESEMAIGLGFTNDEVPFLISTAAHDLVVGLICFDVIYLPLSALHRIRALLGDSFWRLTQTDVVKFVHIRQDPAILSAKGALMGGVGLITLSAPAGGPESVGMHIRRQLKPVPGMEAAVERLFSELEPKVILFAEESETELADLMRASLMMPEVARLLGIGEAILPSQVPIWLRFPCLRMAHLVQTGAVCDRLGIQAAKIPFGGVLLTSAAFGVQSASESADQYASYVLSGKFNTDLGAALVADPSILEGILRFRDTAEGEAFRREVRDQLLTDAASEFPASVNAGLARNIPLQILQKAQDQLSSLLTERVSISSVPAVWANSLQSDDSTRFWRAKSRSLLMGLTKERGIGGNDPCICGSGDKLRLCCLASLRD